MKRRARACFSEVQKAMMWDRWQRGDTLRDIARLVDRGHSSIQLILSKTGGIRPIQRVRSSRALSLSEREEISRAVVAGCSMRSIAARLGRAPSTISREIRRHGGCHAYRASHADAAAWDQARRPKISKLAQYRPLARLVAKQLKRWWSPEQIAGWLIVGIQWMSAITCHTRPSIEVCLYKLAAR